MTPDSIDQARARFAAEVNAALREVETAARMTLDDALEKAEASLCNRARKLMDEARLIECARCEAVARRNWWRRGTAIAAKLWSGE